MLENLTILAATDKTPLERFKDVVNHVSVPQYSLPIIVFFVFVPLMIFYRKWTKPIVILPLTLGFMLVYFGSMAIDKNYYAILAKPDNVPITMMLLGVGFCLWWAMRQAAINDERLRTGRPLIEEEKDDKVLVWPDLVYTEMICMIIGSALLLVWAVVLKAPLEAPANPAGPPNPSKAPWYFLGLQEMLVYFDPWMAGVVLPTMILTGLIAIPYIDTNPKGNGYFTMRQRPFAIVTWLFGFVVLWVVLIVFGTFLRGPNWNFFGPYEVWDPNFQVPLTNVMMSDYMWNPKGLFGFGWSVALPKTPLMRELFGILFAVVWIFLLPPFLARTVMRRMYVQMGSARFYILGVHLVVMGLLPLKMVLRWVFNLKYFIYLPEYNFNL